MRAIVQRVSSASVTIEGKITGQIGPGLLILLGVEAGDTSTDGEGLAGKISKLRIFPDETNSMNRSVNDVTGGVLVISQFTLFSSTQKGNRPSFQRAAPPSEARPLYEQFLTQMQSLISSKVERGIFGADMKVALVNDGPVTLILDSKLRE